MHPWLATGYAFEDGGTELRITIRAGVRLSDGTAFGPADVAATFRAIRDDPAADYSGVPPQSADPTVDAADRTVTLHFVSPQYGDLWSILGSTYIVPAALVAQLGSRLATAVVSDPVGTGPFTLAGFSAAEMRFTANPRYWGGPPAEPEIVVPYEPTDNAVIEALDSGRLDWWSGLPLPGWGNLILCLDAGCTRSAPSTPAAPGGTITLEFNLAPGNGGATGIGDPAVRQAISLGIDRTVLSSISESGYEVPALSAGGLDPAQLAAYPDPTYTDDLPVDSAATPTSVSGWSGPTVQSALEADGWTPPAAWGTSREANCDGTVVADCWHQGGAIIEFSIWGQEALSDCWADAQEISGELQSEGMDVYVTNAPGGELQWQGAIEAGDFQTAIHASARGGTPFVDFDAWLDYAVDCTTSGESLSCPAGDDGRFHSAAAETALQQYEAANTSTVAGRATIAVAVSTLEGIMATEVPDAPLLYGADWDLHDTAHYCGWPSLIDPAMDPSPLDPELPYLLMQLRPVPSS